MQIQFFKLYAVAFIVLFYSSVKAQDDQDYQVEAVLNESLQDLLNVGMVSASKKKQSLQDAPATAYVVNAEMIQQRGYLHLLDLLEDIPEVEIQYNANPQVRNLVTFRGIAGNEKILLMVNGVRVTPSTGDFYIIGANFSLADASRVEVIIGPASALYGADAFGGIVNIITHNQEDFNHDQTGVAFSGGNSTTTNTTAHFGFKADRLIVSGAFNHYYSAEPALNETYDLTFDWYNNSFQPKGYVVESPYYGDVYEAEYFQERAGESSSGEPLTREFHIPTYAHYAHLNATYEGFTIGYLNHAERHSSALSLDPKYTAFEQDQFFKQSQHVLYAKHTYNSFNNKWSLQSNLTHNFYQIDPESNFIGSSSRWQRGYIYGNGQSIKIEEQLSVDISSRSSIMTGFSFELLNSLPTTGLTPSPIDPNTPLINQDAYFIGAAGYDPYAPDSTVGVIDSSRMLTQDIYQISYKNYGAYFQWQKRGKKLDLTLGGRYDFNSRYGHTINPRLGLVWTMSRKIKAKFLAGSAYLAPSPQKAYTQSGSFFRYTSTDSLGRVFDSDYYRTPNTELRPEKLFSLETNWSYFITKNISLNVNAFYTSVSDLINFYGDSELDLVKKDDAYIYSKKIESSVNESFLDVYGVVPKLNFLFNIGNTKWNTWFSYTYINGELYKDDEFSNIGFVPYTTEETVKGGVDFSANKWGFSVRGIMRGPSYTNQDIIYREIPTTDLDNKYYSDGFFLLNANLYATLKSKGNNKITAFARGRNILNTIHYNTTLGSDDSNGIYPQDLRRIMGGLSINW